ncbi:MAG TPA: DUF2971 domain-containing protein [Devosia sp.]|jgi:hypothetical protein|uniref:DUF2971 domain-containing protein n=1 Tax=Devosia sp. TaxID=1871048 RepID=UPI002F94AA0D
MNKEELRQIFMPYHSGKLARLEREKMRLAYYTNFETAKLIVDNRAIWLRNTAHMNDLNELEHGVGAIEGILAKPSIQARLTSVLSPIDPNLGRFLLAAWQRIKGALAGEVYITCVTEHPAEEDNFGRLSMWRAYSQPDGVAIVMNTDAFKLETNELNAYSSPVFYGYAADAEQQLLEVLEAIESNISELAALGAQFVAEFLALTLLFGAVCLKHPGFVEEAEWRVVHMPTLIPRKSRLVRRDNMLDPPQTIYEIPLIDDPKVGLIGLDPNLLFHRMIVGPSIRSEAIEAELIQGLEAQGVKDAGQRIIRSGIPLRPTSLPKMANC